MPTLPAYVAAEIKKVVGSAVKTPEEIKDGLDTCGKRRICLSDCPYFGEDGCSSHLEADALDYIQQLEAQVPKWISMEERLPEAKMAVLAYGQRVVFNGKKIETFPMERVAYTRGEDEGWFSWDSGDLIEVTHWMPLPEPPKEEEK